MAKDTAIVLFDGVCLLCNQTVLFILKRDPKHYFRFGSLQSPKGQELLEQYGLPPKALDSLVLIEQGKVYTYSTAPLRIARKLSLPWPLLTIFLLIPSFIRHPIYRWIAKNRYKWFGKKDQCMPPTPDMQDYFLD